MSLQTRSASPGGPMGRTDSDLGSVRLHKLASCCFLLWVTSALAPWSSAAASRPASPIWLFDCDGPLYNSVATRLLKQFESCRFRCFYHGIPENRVNNFTLNPVVVHSSCCVIWNCSSAELKRKNALFNLILNLLSIFITTEFICNQKL